MPLPLLPVLPHGPSWGEQQQHPCSRPPHVPPAARLSRLTGQRLTMYLTSWPSSLMYARARTSISGPVSVGRQEDVSRWNRVTVMAARWRSSYMR